MSNRMAETLAYAKTPEELLALPVYTPELHDHLPMSLTPMWIDAIAFAQDGNGDVWVPYGQYRKKL